MNVFRVVPKTIFQKHWCLLGGLLLIGNCSLTAQSQADVSVPQQDINKIEQLSGCTPWQWATKLTYQWFGLGSSQNRSSKKATTSPTLLSSSKAITADYQLNNNQLTLSADFGRMLHTQIRTEDEAFSGRIEPAGFDTLTTYSYAGFTDDVLLNCKWSVAGKTYFGKLNSTNELVYWMNSCEPTEKWTLNEYNQQVEGSRSEKDCGTLEISCRSTNEKRIIDPVVQFPPKGTILHLKQGTQFLSFQEPGVEISESLVLEKPVEPSPSTVETSLHPHSPITAFVQPKSSNAYLFIQGVEEMPGHQLSVFNRWGREIYHTIKYQNNWSGDSQDGPVPEGIYYYVLNNGQGETYTGCFNIRS